jgi:hypothetical protein
MTLLTADFASDYPETRGTGSTRDWSYQQTGYAFTAFLDTERFAGSTTTQEKVPTVFESKLMVIL